MEERKSWLRENWRLGLVLVLILGLAMFLRTYFVYGEFAPAGFWSGGGDYSGGSDPFYWERALLYSFQTGKEISWDYAMNYPIGFPDVRPPLFDWFNLLAGYVGTPFFGGNTWWSMVWMLNMNAAIFGVLSIIPTYLIGKEAFGKRAGLLAAFLLAISAAALSRSHATIAVHDSWTLFFVICAFYFYLRALKTLNRRRWVENWFQPSSVTTGLKSFFRESRKSILYAFLAGLSVGVTALSWQGWAYVPVILVLIFFVELLLDRIRNQDVMGVTVLFMIILAIPLLISFPWYSVRGLIHVWWDVPFYLFLVAAAIGIVFSVTRDYPWTLVLPGTFIAGGIGLLIGFTVNPALLFAFYSGAGYFVKNKVYSTIAEAQEPGMSELILSFGMFTFGIGLVAVGYMIWQTPKRNNPAFTMLVLWTFGALFMALAAARFIFNAAPVMAIATGYALDLILTRMGFEEMKRTFRSLSEGSWRNAFRKSVKPRHVIVILLLVGLVILPNVWFAVDSGIPYELKPQYDQQIQNALPAFLQAPGYSSTVSSGSTFYLGAFGYSLPNETQYFPAAYSWLDTQDTNVPLVNRPSVLAWWDYGFEITERGGHPVVADPFQNGYAIAGQMLLAQNESSAIALMTVRLLEGNLRHNWPHLTPTVAQVLSSYGIDPSQVPYAFQNAAALIPVILSHPGTYGLWDPTLTAANSPYIYLDALFLQKLNENQLVNLYSGVEAATGTSIGYFMVDTRLFPLSASNTGIFYAPAKLSDHRTLNLVSGQVLPYDFFQIFANTTNAANLPIQDVPALSQITAETIQYQPMFYNSMFYRAFVGYPPSAIGQTNGIPGISSSLTGYSPMPAWNMTHFRVVYRTAYYNPYSNPTNHTGAWQAVNYNVAQYLQQQISAGNITGVVDMSTATDIQNGAVILQYYPGAYVNGTVTVNGVPVPGAWVTVTDELGTPHGVVKTDARGHYSLLAPFGNITIAASTGTLNNLTLVGGNVLASTTFPVSEAQAMRSPYDANGDGTPDWLITKNLAVPAAAVRGTLYYDLNRNSAFDAGDLAVPGATVSLSLLDTNLTENATTDPTGSFSFPSLAPGSYGVTVTTEGHTLILSSLTVASGTSTQNLGVPFASVGGTALDASGTALPGATVALTDSVNGTMWQATANATGVYAFNPVLPGSYTLSASLGQNAALPTYVSVGVAGVEQNLTLLPEGRVVGATQLYAMDLPFATIQFQNTAQTYMVAQVTSDASGAYSVSLPAGDWNVYGRLYQGADLYATLGQVTVRQGETTSYDADFTAGARVGGSVTAQGQSGDLRAAIGFIGSTGEVWIRSALGNTYLAYLPQGTYSVVANTPTDAYSGALTLNGAATLDLHLLNATSLAGTVFWDMNGNGRVDTGEGISGARIALRDNTGALTVGYANTTGGFDLTLFADRTYSGSVTADGFAPYPISAATPAEIGTGVAWAMTPRPVDLVGSAYLNGTPLLNRALPIRAEAVGGGAVSANGTTFTDGSYSLPLTPGTYLIQVDTNVTSGNDTWRYQTLSAEPVGIPVAWGTVTDNLTIVARVKVVGNVTLGGVAVPASVSFTGPDDVSLETNATGGYQVYLQAGTYSVRADKTVSGTPYGVLQNATVPVTGNLSLALGPAAQISGSVTYDGAALTVPMGLTFARQEGGSFQALSSANGTYSVYLVPGNYTVTLANATSETVAGIRRYFTYTFQGNLTVPTGPATLSYAVSTTRSYDNTTVEGLVTVNGGGVDAPLSFIAQSNGALNASTVAAENGSYTVSLAPGTYVVYASRVVGSTAFLGTLIVPHAAVLPFDVPLLPAFQLTGATTDPSGALVPATVNLTGAAALSVASDASGYYAALLPAGLYTLIASRTQVEQGVSVTYQGSASFDLSTDTTVNVQLGRLDEHAVALSWDAAENRTISPGGAVTYTVTVQNTGNVGDTFNLSGYASGWTFSFAPASVTLGYGNMPNATTVQVTIQSPPDALVDHATITITATSTADNNAKGSVVVDVGITRVRGLTLQVDPTSGTFDGSYLNYTVDVTNSGNAPETVDLSIQNPSDIAAAGWTPGLAAPGSQNVSGTALTSLSVAANTTAAARLVLRLSGANGAATVALAVHAVDAPAVAAQTVYTATLPQLSTPSAIGVTGNGITLSLPPNEILLAILVGAVAAIAAGWYLTRRGH